jgi:hypothetical protein
MNMPVLEGRPGLGSLPFTAKDASDAITSMWTVITTGDYAEDNALGRNYANDTMSYIVATDSCGVLYQIAKAQSRHKMGGIEIGFWTQIALFARSGKMAGG